MALPIVYGKRNVRSMESQNLKFRYLFIIYWRFLGVAEQSETSASLNKLIFFFFWFSGQPSGSELQKSIQIATNVLSFSHKNEKCQGCCNHQLQQLSSESYGQPEIHLINGTSKVMTLKPGRSIRNLTAQICANPPVDRIILETPFGELLKPGQQSSDKALKLQSWGTLSKVTR